MRSNYLSQREQEELKALRETQKLRQELQERREAEFYQREEEYKRAEEDALNRARAEVYSRTCEAFRAEREKELAIEQTVTFLPDSLQQTEVKSTFGESRSIGATNSIFAKLQPKIKTVDAVVENLGKTNSF